MSDYYKFPIVPRFYNNRYTDIDYEILGEVHPLKQEGVYDFIKFLEESRLVKKAILFGSSVREDCTERSDTDIAISYKEGVEGASRFLVHAKLAQIFGEYDMLEIEDCKNGTTLCDEVKGGLVIYEHPERRCTEES